MVFNLRHSVAEGSLGCFLARLALGGSFSGRLWLPLAHLARWGVACSRFRWSQVTETIQNIQRGQPRGALSTKYPGDNSLLALHISVSRTALKSQGS